MSGRDKQWDDEENEITAQPKSMPEELGMLVGHEQGLSVDPDDLGRTFLSDATEQGNFESSRGGENDELWAGSSASDEALTGPNFEVDKDVWENTVSLTLQNGAGAVSDPLVEDEDSASDDGLHAVEDREAGDIDLTQNAVQEASLFDHEAEELGETEEPHVLITEDAHTHAKHHGVQAALARPSARPEVAAPRASASSSVKPASKSAEPKAANKSVAPKAANKSVAPKATKKTVPPAKKPTPTKASRPQAARSSAPRAR
jgi:hypothetical protein